MHKSFYASGFLYHPATQQILLQQSSSLETLPKWSLFGGTSIVEETAEESFQRIILECLNLKIPIGKIMPIYTYFNEQMKKDYFIFFAQVKSLKKFSHLNGSAPSWFTKAQIQKLALGPQEKHDLTVAGRVIDAINRKDLGQHTLQ